MEEMLIYIAALIAVVVVTYYLFWKLTVPKKDRKQLRKKQYIQIHGTRFERKNKED